MPSLRKALLDRTTNSGFVNSSHLFVLQHKLWIILVFIKQLLFFWVTCVKHHMFLLFISHIVSDGVLWRWLYDRLGEENQRKLFERRLDCLHLPGGAQGKIKHTVFFYLYK